MDSSLETTASRDAQPWPRGTRALLVVCLLGAIYLGYSPALDGEMQFDDLHSIADNPAVKDLGRFARPGALLRGTSRALTDLTFAFNYRVSGLAVRPYHLLNLLLHLATVVALLGLALRILRRLDWPRPFATAFFAAAIFGLHPLQSQAVAYICQRAEVLASLFYLLGLLFALEGEERKGAGSIGAFAAAFLCFFLGWEAKPTIATFPAALLLCFAAFPARDGRWRARLAASLPFWALTVAFSARLLQSTRGAADVGFDVQRIGPREYLLTQSRVILTYLRLLFWPAGQALDWDFPPSRSAFEPHTALALLAILGILLAAGWLWRWSARAPPSEPGALARLWAFGILWFFLQLSPTSSVVPVADVIEEHRVYLASFGILLPAAAAGTLLVRRLLPGRQAAGALAGAAVCLALGIALHQRARVWESALSLWTDTAAKSPRRARAHMNLGYALTPVDPARAVEEYRLALQLAPGSSVNLGRLKQDLAGALLSLHRTAEGIAILQELIAAAPPAPQLETNLAIAYLEDGRPAEARSTAERVTARFPDYAPAWHTLGQLAFARGDYAEASRLFGKAAQLDPDSAVSLSSLAVTEERRGDRAAACSAWERYLRLPGAAEAARAHSAALGCR